MPEKRRRLTSQSPTTNGFDPLSIFREQSSEYNRLPKHTQVIEDHIDIAAQAEAGFTLHDIFVSKTTFTHWVFAIIVQWLSKGDKAITERTSFDVDLEVNHNEKKGSLPLMGSFTDVPLVDAVKSEFNGQQVVIGMLCIPVEIRMDELAYSDKRWGDWFKDLSQNTEVGVRAWRKNEIKNEDMPFNHIPDLNTNYSFALEYGVKKTAEKNKLFQVTTIDPVSVDKNLALFPETFLRQNESGVSLLIWVAHRVDQRLQMTKETPFTINLTIRKGPEDKKHLVKPYNNEISVKPTGVDVVGEFIYGLLIVSVPRNNLEEIQFFEEASRDIRSIDVKYTLTRHG